MQKRFSAIIIACLVLTGCMSSKKYEDLSYGNCTNLCFRNTYDEHPLTFLKRYIKAGANVNARWKDGMTPLHYAAAYGKPAHIKILVDAGADVNARDKDGDTPLHEAVRKTPELVKLLLDAGADVNAHGRYRNTPLHNAANYGNAAIVRILLNAGANPNAQNSGFENPLLAINQRETRPEWLEIASLLQAAGAETKKNTVDKTKTAACRASGLILWDLECAGW